MYKRQQETLPIAIEQNLAWIIKEASTNVMRHSQASHCELVIEYASDKQLIMMMKDNGIGLPSSGERRIGSGIESMKQRCYQIGAELSYVNACGCQLTVVVSISD